MTQAGGRTLSFDDLFTLAERESGAYGRADQALRDRVAGIVEWINGRGPYTPDQLVPMQRQLQRILVNRLRLDLDREQFPAIAEERIEKPIFIVGFARSGTTLLHELLAQDPEVHVPRAWHSRMLSPPPGAGPIGPARLTLSRAMLLQWLECCPAQLTMHPYSDQLEQQVIEDEEIFTLDFRNAYPSMMWRVPTLDVMVVLGDDGRDAFHFHKRVLQHLQWNTGKTRWACKSGSAQHNLDCLLDVYPDALCVWAHRPLSEIYASNVAIRAATFDAINGKALPWTEQPKAHAERMKQAIDRLMDNALIDDPRIVHVPFHQLSKDPVGTIRQIYDRRGIAVSDAYAKQLDQWLADPVNRVDRYGRYPYSYETFGLDKAWIQDLFADYSARFGLKESA